MIRRFTSLLVLAVIASLPMQSTDAQITKESEVKLGPVSVQVETGNSFLIRTEVDLGSRELAFGMEASLRNWMPKLSNFLTIETCYYRHGGQTGKNLTPRDPQDIPSGLSVSTTPKRGWKFTASDFEECFVLCPDDDDDTHFMIKPKNDRDGSKLKEWAATRPGLCGEGNDVEANWHDLTKKLVENGEKFNGSLKIDLETIGN